MDSFKDLLAETVGQINKDDPTKIWKLEQQMKETKNVSSTKHINS